MDAARDGRRIAVVCNPGGGRVRKRLVEVRREGRRLAGERYREAADAAGIARAVREVLAQGADVLCLVGGDGTVQAALTAVDRAADPGAWPLLAPVAGGTANVTARDLDAGEPMLRRLERLRRWRDGVLEGRRLRRAVLRVEHPDVGTLCGMFFGTGLAATGVRYFQERPGGLETTGQRTSALVVARVLWGLAFGGMEETVEPRSLTAAPDGDPPRDHTCLLCVAGTLERFLLGTRPYWGAGEDPIHFTLVERGARRLWRRLPRLATGRAGDVLTPEEGYRSRDVRSLALRFDGPFVIDGELHRVRAGRGPVLIEVADEPEWLTF